MNPFWGFVKKEFLHIIRDVRTLVVLFGLPVAQILIFGFVIRNEIEDVSIAILDKSGDPVTREITNDILASGFFKCDRYLTSVAEIEPAFKTVSIREVLVFEDNFAARLEKEISNIEQINVTPIRKMEFLTGKLVPFWIIAMFELALGLFIGKIMFNIPLEGSLILLFFYAAFYMAAMLGIGLLISTMSQTQQQAQFLNFFVLVTFIMLSGIFTPEESLPGWAKDINLVNPIAYFIRVNRMILLKGSGIGDIKSDLLIMFVMAVVFIALANWRYRKTA